MNFPRLTAWLSLLLAVWSGSVRAQDEEQEEEELGEEDLLDEEFTLLEDSEKVYTASRHEESILESPATVTVISREEIENTHCLDLSCLLRQVPEIEVRQMNSYHHSVGARALASEANDKVLLLVDNREDNIESLGMPFWQVLGLHLEDIERIEVVRGPASPLYGANAHSLVVNITTRKPKADRVEAFLGGGELGRLSTSAFVHRIFGPWHFSLRAGRETQEDAGRWQKAGMRERLVNWIGLYLNRQWQLGTSALDLSYSNTAGLLTINFMPAEIKEGHLIRAYLSHKQDWIDVRFWYQLVSLESFFNVPLVYGGTKLGEYIGWLTWNNHATDTELQLTRSFFTDNLLVAGTNYRWLGMYLEGNRPNWVDQHRVGFFLHDEQRLGVFLLVAGARLDYNSITPFTVSPRAAVVWRYLETQSVRVGAGRAFRKPAFCQTSIHQTNIRPEPGFEGLAEFVANSIGNDKLANENVNSFELGWRGSFFDGSLFVDADAFFNMYRDAIAFTLNIVEDNFGLIDLSRSWIRFENKGWNINSLGGSVAAVWRWNDTWRLSANYTFRHSWYLSESPETALYDKGDRVPWEPAHLFNLSVHLKLENGLRMGLTMNVRSAFWERWTKDGGLFSDEIKVPEPARALLGGYLAWRWGEDENWLEIGLRVQDLLAVKYRDLTGVTRFDGAEMGGLYYGRLLLAYLRGGV